LHFCHAGGDWPILQLHSLAWINTDAILVDDVSQILDLMSIQGALLRIGIQVVVPKELQDCAQVPGMLFRIWTENQDVIQIDNRTFAEYGPQYLLHDFGERRGCIGHPEWDDGVLEVAKWRDESTFRYVFWMQSYLSVTCFKVQ
jgi:hypothetical protein